MRDLVTEAAEVVPDCHYVGWDVVIADRGPLPIEGNGQPSVDLPQCYLHVCKKEDMVHVMEQALDIKLR